jgi:hypothetical protein
MTTRTKTMELETSDLDGDCTYEITLGRDGEVFIERDDGDGVRIPSVSALRKMLALAEELELSSLPPSTQEARDEKLKAINASDDLAGQAMGLPRYRYADGTPICAGDRFEYRLWPDVKWVRDVIARDGTLYVRYPGGEMTLCGWWDEGYEERCFKL